MNKERPKKVTSKKVNPVGRPVRKLIQDLDKIFSLYIRLKGIKNGLCRCVTCGKTGHFKEMQNGHYISRSCHALRWDERNCHVQCVGCNVFRNGNLTEYAEWMIKTYGVEIIKEFNQKKHETTKLNRHELIEKISFYKNAVRELEYF